jgi:hypothetical protein
MKFDKLRFVSYFHEGRSKPGHDVSEEEARQIIGQPIAEEKSYGGRFIHWGVTSANQLAMTVSSLSCSVAARVGVVINAYRNDKGLKGR